MQEKVDNPIIFSRKLLIGLIDIEMVSVNKINSNVEY